MRAHAMWRALAERHRISLAVIAIFDLPWPRPAGGRLTRPPFSAVSRLLRSLVLRRAAARDVWGRTSTPHGRIGLSPGWLRSADWLLDPGPYQAPIGSWKRAGVRAGERTHLKRGPGHRRGGSSRAALPKAYSWWGTVPAAEGQVDRNYDLEGIWQRGKVGLGRTSPTLAARQLAGGGYAQAVQWGDKRRGRFEDLRRLYPIRRIRGLSRSATRACQQ